ncbi:MAG: hypothetical protein GX447_03455 [Elusimicrobia bacterium]|nr:hypothetical protein [Elusimicrobiota bacterium]
MKLLCLGKILFFLIFSYTELNAARTAFYYGKNFPPSEISFYDRIIVQPDNLPSNLLSKYPEKFFAYFSVCEKNNIQKDLILGENTSWNSKIGDIRKEKYSSLLIDEISSLYDKGFRNFFLDTLDSYFLVLKNQKDIKDYEISLINFISQAKNKFPNSQFILNRGFEIMKEAKPYASALAAESLYFGINPKEKEYLKIKEEDSAWLKEKLLQAKQLGYEVIVIDYLPTDKKAERISLARKIKQEGFTPYVSDYNLEKWGQTEYEKIPREIIIFFDSQKVSDKVYSQAHRLASAPLEYHGYIPKIKDIREPLPQNLEETHAVIFLTESEYADNNKRLLDWTIRAINSGKKILFLGSFPFPPEPSYFSPFGITISKNKARPGEPNILLSLDKYYSVFESPFYFYHSDYLLNAQVCRSIISFKNNYDQIHSQASLCPWGGYALSESWVTQIDNKELFQINPYYFFKEALALKDFPVPDPTTQNGRRVLVSHIDGDGFSSFSEIKKGYYNAEILKKEILEKYPIPHSVSIIRGEIESPSLDEKQKERLKKSALEIFSLPWVEMANHSFSHPFKWVNLSSAGEYDNIEQLYSLNIPGYSFNINEEILGTKKWLEKEFSLSGKKNEIFFWTGDCVAPQSALKILKENGMRNINGGYTVATRENPYLSLIAPFGIERDGYYQIYSGQQNENIYTNLWSGPFWGYSKAIETFELTEKPLRLKPINIYYHFYSAQKQASINALKKVYDYAISLKTNPIYASQYADTVNDFYESGIYNYGSSWIFAGNGSLKTLRLSQNYYPEIKYSAAGFEKNNSVSYVHLYGNPPFEIEVSNSPEKKPYLKNSSCYLENFKSEGEKIYFSLSCSFKTEFETENTSKCVSKKEKIYSQEIIKEKIYAQCQ